MFVAQLRADAFVGVERRALVVAVVLLIAGVYQFTPLKAACVRACRSRATFLMQRWRGGIAGAFRLGLEHGWYCLGCCWALMAVLVFVGSMSLGAVVAVATVVALESSSPDPRPSAESSASGSWQAERFCLRVPTSRCCQSD